MAEAYVADRDRTEKCVEKFHQELCVEFDVTFKVDVDCRVKDVKCLEKEAGVGPCPHCGHDRH